MVYINPNMLTSKTIVNNWVYKFKINDSPTCLGLIYKDNDSINSVSYLLIGTE